MNQWLKDLRFSFRMLKRTPRISAIVVLCIGLAIGLNATVFSIANALLFRSPAVHEPESLVRVYQSSPGFEYVSFSHPNYRDVREHNEVFDGFASGALLPVDGFIDGATEKLACALVTGNYFDVLGVSAAQGRALNDGDDVRPGGHPVAVISDRFWRGRLGGRANVVGEPLVLNGQTFDIVGIAPPGFVGTMVLADIDVWVPILMEPVIAPTANKLDSRGSGWMFLTFGRLKEDMDVAQARAGLEVLARQLEAEEPDANREMAFTVAPLLDTVVTGTPSAKGAIWGSMGVLTIMVAFVLIIACANVANLLLSRSEARRREMAIRMANGAQRSHLFRQLLTESVTLALFGGVLGVALALWSSTLLPRLVPSVGIPLVLDLSLDTRVLGVTAGATLAAGILFGLAPAWRSSRTHLVASLRGDEHSTGTWMRRFSLSQALVVVQVALCVLLLVGAALFIRGLERATTIDPGFATEGMLLAAIDPSLQGFDEEQVRSLYRSLEESLESQAGVESVSFAEVVPLSLARSQQWSVDIDGYVPAEGERMNPDYNVVSPDYFAANRIRLLEGRGFNTSDDEDGLAVVVVNQTMAQRYWPDRSAIGGMVQLGGVKRQVVGITDDILWKSLTQDPEPYLYLPWTQIYEPAMEIHVRTTHAPASLIPTLRSELARLAPNVALADVRTLAAHSAVALFPARAGAGFFAVFGGLALVLASVGLYGVLSYRVSRQTREIGIRMALGASRRQVFSETVRSGATLAVVGLVVGILGALAVSRILSSFLYGLSGTDALSYVVAILFLGLTAFVACALPARRATNVAPHIAIRSD